MKKVQAQAECCQEVKAKAEAGKEEHGCEVGAWLVKKVGKEIVGAMAEKADTQAK